MVEDSQDRARDLLAKAVDFHGHLGPFLVLGLRMGVMALSILKPQKLGTMTANMFVRSDPPESCVVDGVQVGSGCTLGKGTIRILSANNRIAGEFRGADRACTITVKAQVLNALLRDLRKATDKEVLEMAEDVLSRPDNELFEIASSP